MNESIFFFFYNLSHQSAIFDKLIVFFAETFPFIVIALAGLFLLFHHEVFKADNTFQVFLEKKKEILGAFFAGALAWVLAQGLKLFFAQPRPFEMFAEVTPLFPETGFAMPSGHATFFMALALSLFFHHRKAGHLFMFFALVIGLARVVAGVHFPLDILGGFILGAVIAYLFKKI